MVEVASTVPGDLVELEFDQRYAMERNYDYGYVEVSGDGGGTWTTLAAYNNTGFQGAGVPHNWNHPTDGHVVHDISTYAGIPIELRFRFESDIAYSSQDQYDNSQHSVKDGAWQLDNITIKQNGSPIFYDDSESGNMGWVHDPLPPAGQTGVRFEIGQNVQGALLLYSTQTNVYGQEAHAILQNFVSLARTSITLMWVVAWVWITKEQVLAAFAQPITLCWNMRIAWYMRSGRFARSTIYHILIL